MYKLMNYVSGVERSFGVLDTNDFEVEFVDIDMIRACEQRGIKIDGIIREKNILKTSLQKPVIPMPLLEKMNKWLSSYTADEDEISELRFTIVSNITMRQRAGENLLKLSKKVTDKDFCEMSCI